LNESPEPLRALSATPLGRRNKCPSCGSRSVARISYGMPVPGPALDQDLASGRLVLGGCLVFGEHPDRYCNECGHQWRRKPSPNRQRKDLL
jgi:hypothetical protein